MPNISWRLGKFRSLDNNPGRHGDLDLDTGHQDQLSKDMINRKVSIGAGQSANTGQPGIKWLKFRGGNVSYDHSLKIVRTCVTTYNNYNCYPLIIRAVMSPVLVVWWR